MAERKKVPLESAYKAFPRLNERVMEVGDRYDEMTYLLRNIANGLIRIRSEFPDLEFNFSDFTFIDPYHPSDRMRGQPQSLNRFLSPGTSYWDRSSQPCRRVISDLYDIRGKKRQNETRLREKILPKTILAIVTRLNNETRSPRIRKSSNKITGTYLFDYAAEPHGMLLTDDPVDVLRKSSGQWWQMSSCEDVVRGEYRFCEGVYSDIKHSNICAFLYHLEHRFPVARAMVRRCMPRFPTKRVEDFGIEPFWYVKGDRRRLQYDSCSPLTEFTGHENISSSFATHVLARILVDNGFYNYDFCETRYHYRGYSDMNRINARGQNIDIQYPKLIPLDQLIDVDYKYYSTVKTIDQFEKKFKTDRV